MPFHFKRRAEAVLRRATCLSIYLSIYLYKIYKNYCFPNGSCRKGKKQATNFTFQVSNSKFQAETRIKISKGGLISFQNRMNKIKILSLEK